MMIFENKGINRRISLSGGEFHKFIDGEKVGTNKKGSFNAVIVNAAPLSRTYYSGTYDPQTPTSPKCWSADTTTPASEVRQENRQATRCIDCQQNIKGSGQGQGRACRFAQRIAVVLEGNLDEVYQIQLPATSLFGRTTEGKMPMQAYAQYLNSHSRIAISVMTKFTFDKKSAIPKLFFKAVRPLEEGELKKVVEMKDDSDTLKAISLSTPIKGTIFAEVEGFVYDSANANEGDLNV